MQNDILKIQLYGFANTTMPNNIKPFIDSLVNERKKQMMSQSKLGRSLHLPQSYISQIENGHRDSRFSVILDIARVLGLEIVLVPRQVLPAVESIIRQFNGSDGEQEESAYQFLLDDEETDDD
ncbi:MAG TPA: XRE family transcriptional regulator [Candidatus Melainabacteria bacterium]|nr:XRE family transcriptional regulator [Candidatus Melainabacteria bacterium]HIN63499.1 XRE family transcriptional regulator [Candidatus Obscuribacterales bacterium]